jgi:hypothetical protein
VKHKRPVLTGDDQLENSLFFPCFAPFVEISDVLMSLIALVSAVLMADTLL